MSDIEQRIRERAYQLWEQAGRPDEHTDQFWFTARQEIEGDTPPLGDRPAGAIDFGAEERSLEEPPAAGAVEGEPAGMPGERIAEPGVPDDGGSDLATPDVSSTGGRRPQRTTRTTSARKAAESEDSGAGSARR